LRAPAAAGNAGAHRDLARDLRAEVEGSRGRRALLEHRRQPRERQLAGEPHDHPGSRRAVDHDAPGDPACRRAFLGDPPGRPVARQFAYHVGARP
jgi:hypothetical protein